MEKKLLVHGPYIAIDAKSYYSSVECVDRGLDPLTTNLLVADESRSDATICLAVSPSLKALGVPGRPRLFQAKQKIAEAEARLRRKIDYIIAPPRMARYLEVSATIYGVYLKYIAPQDIHIYSIDEIFIDAGPYLGHLNMTAHELTVTLIRDVLRTTGITATAGIGTNLYLAKIAMDIVAKKAKADRDGVRIAELDERKYKELLWDHLPLTDFWMISHGTVNRLARLAEIDGIVRKLYEDNYAGKLSDERFAKLSEGYETEQAELKASAEKLRGIVDDAEEQARDVERFMRIVRKNIYPTELTPTLLHSLVDKIVIHEKTKDADGHRFQKIEILYSFVGTNEFSPEYSKYSKK